MINQEIVTYLKGEDKAEVIYKEAFLSNSEHDNYFEKINSEVNWSK